MNFREYAHKRLVEDLGLSIDAIRAMILKSLGGNPDNKEAGDSPLSQFAVGSDLLDRLNSLNGLKQLIGSNPAAIEALEKAQQTNLKVSELAGILFSGQGTL